MRFRKKNDKVAPATPQGPGWDSRLMAVASGAAIIAQPVLALGFFSSLVVGEATGTLLAAAQDRHDKSKAAHDAWHLSLLREKAAELTKDMLAKKPQDLTDMDRIRLALFAEWELLDTREMPPAFQAEVLRAELLIACGQNGLGCVRIAKEFSFPALAQKENVTARDIAALAMDKKRMRALIDAGREETVAGRLQKKVSRSFADAAVNVVTRKPSIFRSTLSLMVDFPALKKAWDIMSAKGASRTPEDFMNRMCRDFLGSYRKGENDARRAARRMLRGAGVPYESSLVKKPEGGYRHVVRPK